jgi:hypothetical protein
MRGITRGVLAIGLSLSLGVPILSAQTPVQFGLGGGVSIPTGSSSDGLKTGFHGMALVQFKPASVPVGFQIDGAFHQLKFEGGGGKSQVIDGTANVLYEFKTSEESMFRPYLIGGGGVYNVKDKFDVGGSVSDTKFGLNGGAGFNIKSSGVGIFVEGRFHNVFLSNGPDFHMIPITAGVRFGGT